MTDGVLFNQNAASRIASATKWIEQNKANIIPSGNGVLEPSARNGRHPMRIVITTEEIDPNTFGGFQFTTGSKGSETGSGDTYQGFYRAAEDATPIPDETLCYAIWIPCDSLASEQTGWELSPCLCLED